MVLMLRSVEDVQRHLPKWQVWRVRRDVIVTSRSRSKAVEVGVEVLHRTVRIETSWEFHGPNVEIPERKISIGAKIFKPVIPAVR
jgi:hypothetical protein